MSKKIKVNIIDNGPIQLSGFDSIKYCGEAIDSADQVYLCRCGNSQNSPFCDGAHIKSGFSGANEISEKQSIQTWDGKTIRTHFNANICMHARKCRPLGELRKKELEEGSATTAQEIARVVTACPSGALSYEMVDGANEIEFESSGMVEIMEGGEIRLECDIDGDGIELQERQPWNRVTLCRCGLSKNKPFCDASHTNKENFK